MRKHVKGNVSWVGYLDWELEKFHGDEYSIVNGSSQNACLVEEAPARMSLRKRKRKGE